MSSSEALQREYDLIVIGSGSAGAHAAVQAAKIHKRVCIIESDPERAGGSWIHTGTLPSKTLREGLAAIHNLHEHLGPAWVHRLIEDLQTGKLMGRAHQVSIQEEQQLQAYLKANQIQMIRGRATLESAHAVRVNTASSSQVLTTHYIFIATGSRPARPAHIPFDHWRVIDSDDVFNLEAIPKTMVIYGAGVIGCEYACIFAAMGTKVTLVHSRPQILQYCDQELVSELRSFMEGLGIRFVLGEKTKEIHVSGPLVTVRVGQEDLEAEVFFWASGRVPCTEDLGLKKLGVDCDEQKAVLVNDSFQTSVHNIYAAGDAIGPPALAATASQQGRFVACHAFGITLGSFPKDYPIGIYTIPECSMVGKTEEALLEEGRSFVVGRAYYHEVVRSMIGGKSKGLLKLLIDSKTHAILGVHIVGEDACNLVHIGLAFMTKGGHAQDFVNMVFNYPTLAEAYRIAAFNGLNKLFPDGVIKAPPFERRRNLYSSIKPQ